MKYFFDQLMDLYLFYFPYGLKGIFRGKRGG